MVRPLLLSHEKYVHSKRTPRKTHTYQTKLKSSVADEKQPEGNFRSSVAVIFAARVTALERAGAARAAALDKLHLSALQLLEGVEALEAKVDRALPDVRREVARAEAGVAQLQAGVQVLKEQQENQRVTVRALAGGQAALQEKLEGARALFANVTAAANASAPPPAHGDDAGDVEARLGRVERQLHHMQEAAWVPDAFANASTNASAGAKPDGNEGDVHNMVRQLARVQEEYQNIVSRLPAGEFWLGNTALHRLTADNCSTLRVDLRDIYGKVWVAEYSDFHVSSAADGFRLRVSGYSGNASDALDYQNRMQFSAIDADRDASNTHCAANYEGGWWFSHCQHANLNGRYNLGLTWFDAARNEWIAVAWSEMKVRRRPACAT
ncbi:Protein scabrous [Gryllus bimaculatus]|nr:Protein scabrous [Gryllus bimaculatus]